MSAAGARPRTPGGAVAAGHPETAEAGASVLRAGGNAVDAAIAAVLASVVTESPLTGLGAGGYMIVHDAAGETTLLDFFVAAPGLAGTERGAELVPIEIDFGNTVQTFNIGVASCGVPGVPAGLAEAQQRFGSMPLAELAAPAVRLAREGFRVNDQQAYLFALLAPILTHTQEGADVYAPGGSPLRAGDTFAYPELGETLERFGAEGAAAFYGGEIAARISAWVGERGGLLSERDFAAYEPIAREPVSATYLGREVRSNAPPSPGGTLIAYVLAILDRLGRSDPLALVTAMEQAQSARNADFLSGLYRDGFAGEFLAPGRLDEAARRCAATIAGGGGELPGERLGSTTHIATVDSNGVCASVTCSNGSGSGVIVPGTGVQLNNMMGEEDLNPGGFHSTKAGLRMPSMMSPTVALRDGEVELVLGSAGSNRIRSAVLQTLIRVLADGMGAAAAIDAPRLHFEAGIVHAEPGISRGRAPRLGPRGRLLARAQPLLRRRPGDRPRPGDWCARRCRRSAPWRRCGLGLALGRAEARDRAVAVAAGAVGDLPRARHLLAELGEDLGEHLQPGRLGLGLEQRLLLLDRDLYPGGDLERLLGLVAELGVAADRFQQLLERLHRRAWVGARLRIAAGDPLDLGQWELVPFQPGVDAEALVAFHEDVHAAVLELLEHLLDDRGAADRAGAVVGAEDDPEGDVLVQTVLDHRLVAVLEDVQRDLLGGQQYQRQFEDRYL